MNKGQQIVVNVTTVLRLTSSNPLLNFVESWIKAGIFSKQNMTRRSLDCSTVYYVLFSPLSLELNQSRYFSCVLLFYALIRKM